MNSDEKLFTSSIFALGSFFAFKAHKSFEFNKKLLKISYEPTNKYIHKFTLKDKYHAKFFIIKEKCTRYNPPMYMNVGHNNSFGIPIGGGTTTKFEQIYKTLISTLPSYYVFDKNRTYHISNEYLYSQTYHNYNSMSEYLTINNIPIDIHRVRTTSDSFKLLDGTDMKDIYLYGEAKKDEYLITHVSDNPAHLANKISPFILKSIIAGALFAVSTFCIFLKN